MEYIGLVKNHFYADNLRQENAAKIKDDSAALHEEFLKGERGDSVKIQELLDRISEVIAPGGRGAVKAHLKEGIAGKRMLLICDFISIPYTFNILVFLFVANAQRIAKNCEWL